MLKSDSLPCTNQDVAHWILDSAGNTNFLLIFQTEHKIFEFVFDINGQLTKWLYSFIASLTIHASLWTSTLWRRSLPLHLNLNKAKVVYFYWQKYGLFVINVQHPMFTDDEKEKENVKVYILKHVMFLGVLWNVVSFFFPFSNLIIKKFAHGHDKKK